MAEDLAERIARLEDDHARLAAEHARLAAVHEIENLMGRYEFWHVANLHRKCLDDTPGVRAELPGGIYEGRAGVERFFLDYHGGHEAENPDNVLDGDMHMHALTTRVIEVAEDREGRLDLSRPRDDGAALAGWG